MFVVHSLIVFVVLVGCVCCPLIECLLFIHWLCLLFMLIVFVVHSLIVFVVLVSCVCCSFIDCVCCSC